MPNLYYCGNQWGYTPLGLPPNIPGGFCNPPTGLLATAQNQFVTFSWLPPHDYIKFILEYRIAGSADPWTLVNVFGSNYTGELAADTEYEWRVKTVCEVEIRESVYANGPNVSTGTGVPSCGPMGTVAVTNMATFFRVTWSAASGAQYYVIELREVEGQRTPLIFHTQALFYDLYNLVAGRRYEVRVGIVCEFTNNDSGQLYSPWVMFEAVETNCPPVAKINFTASETSIIIGWFPPGPGYTYNIYLDDVLVAQNYPTTSFTFLGLTPATVYNIKVRTNCYQGFSIPTSIDVGTIKAVCPDPTDLVASLLTDTGFTLDWTPAVGIASQQLIINNGTPIPLAAGINTYAVTGMPSGSLNLVVVRSICASSVSPGISTSVQLTGCAAPTGLVVTPGSNSLNICWNPVSNAVAYRLKVTKNVGAVVVFDQKITTSCYLLTGLLASTLYDIEVYTVCGVIGSELTFSTALIGTGTTLAAGACEQATILSSVIGQNTYSATFEFASGRTTGFITAQIRKQSDDSIIQTFTLSEIGTVTFTGLVAATAYKVYIYHAEPGSDCIPTVLTTITTTAVCLPPSNIVLTLQNNQTEILVAITASPSAPPDYALEYRAYSADIWISEGNVTFPYTITGLDPGKYQVRIRSNCPASVSEWVYSDYTCPKPILISVNTQGNHVTIVWEPLVGIEQFNIILTSLAGGEHTYATITNSIEIPNLDWNTNYSGIIQTVCDSTTTNDSDPFTFATGDESGGGTPLCQPAAFSVFVQDCDITDPAPPDDNPPPDEGECVVQAGDWTKISTLFIPITNDPPNDTYFEGTFSIPQAIANGEAALMPGGILGIITSCLPSSTATMTLTILQGGTLNVGSGTLATNGNITVAGTYTSDGSGILIVRLQGNYNKV